MALVDHSTAYSEPIVCSNNLSLAAPHDKSSLVLFHKTTLDFLALRRLKR